jgi:hypothetical protein
MLALLPSSQELSIIAAQVTARSEKRKLVYCNLTLRPVGFEGEGDINSYLFEQAEFDDVGNCFLFQIHSTAFLPKQSRVEVS